MKKILVVTIAFLTFSMSFAQSSVKRPESYNLNRGIEEAQKENFEEALNFLNKEIEANPKNGYAYLWMASVRYRLEEYGRAMTAADQALKNLPKKDATYVGGTYKLRADIFLQLEDTAKAISDLGAALKTMPDNEDFLESRADVYYYQGKYDLADADYNHIKKVNKGSVMGYMGIGRNRIAQKRWDEAIEQLDYAASLYTDYSLAYAFRAEAYLGKKKWSEATDDLITAFSIDHNRKAFALMNNLEEPAMGMMITKMKIQSTSNPNDDSWPYSIASMYKKKRDFKKAISFYQEAQKRDADNVTLTRIAECYYEMGDMKRALSNIEQAIELDSTDMGQWALKATILVHEGAFGKAIETIDKYVEANPEESIAYTMRASVKGKAGDSEGALEDLNISITLSPEDAFAHYIRANIYARHGNDELARTDCQKVIELENSPEKYNYIAYAYARMGETEKAIAALDTILARSEDKGGEYYNAACIYAIMKNKQKALENLEKSLENGYNHVKYIRNIDSDMDFLRDSNEFNELLDRYEKIIDERNAEPLGKETVTIRNMQKTTLVPFTKENGICKVKCKINDLPLYFIFDTGASTVSLSMVEATFMMKNGYFDKKDIVGNNRFVDANGDVSEGTIINLKRVEFGELKLENVRASVVRNQKAPLLLGQTILARLGKIEIDNEKQVIKISGRE